MDKFLEIIDAVDYFYEELLLSKANLFSESAALWTRISLQEISYL